MSGRIITLVSPNAAQPASAVDLQVRRENTFIFGPTTLATPPTYVPASVVFRVPFDYGKFPAGFFRISGNFTVSKIDRSAAQSLVWEAVGHVHNDPTTPPNVDYSNVVESNWFGEELGAVLDGQWLAAGYYDSGERCVRLSVAMPAGLSVAVLGTADMCFTELLGV